MKVAIVTQFPEDPEAPHGGVEAVSVNLTRGLSEYRDLELHVVTMDRDCKEIELSEWNGVTIHRLPGFSGSVLKNAIGKGRRCICEYLRKFNPQVVHSHDTYGLMVKGLQIPRVFTIHGFIYGDTLVSGKKLPWLRSKIWYRIETKGWADQPHIISISPYVRERLTGIVRGVIHDIDNPISERFFEIHRKEKKGIIFSAAVISPRKNTLTLIEAFSHMLNEGVDGELRLAGTVVNPDYGKQVADRIRDLGLAGKIKLLGKINSDQIRDELASASVFALFSLEENSPMAVEEAMAVGIPVVTSNRCGMPYMVKHGETGFLVNPLDTKDIAQRLGHILERGDLRKEMGESAKRVALDRFHPFIVAKRTRAVYYEAFERLHI